MKAFILKCPDDTGLITATVIGFNGFSGVHVITSSARFEDGEIDFHSIDDRRAQEERKND